MNTIFLDIDGVLNSPNDAEVRSRFPHWYKIRPSQPGDFISLAMARLLKDFCDSYAAEVVIVSSWASSEDDLSEIKKMLDVNVVAKTKYTGGGINRGESVYRYVRENNIDRYVILDDSWEEMYGDHSHVVKISGRAGITSANINQAMFILDGFLNS